MVNIKALLSKIIQRLNSHHALLGSSTMTTSAQTVTDAINQLDDAVAVTSTTATANSNITASRKNCRLIKIGKVVFITIGMGNVTSSVNTNTTLFTVPSGYRPSSEVTIQGYIGNSEGNFTIATNGVVKQTLTSSVTNLYATGFYTVS